MERQGACGRRIFSLQELEPQGWYLQQLKIQSEGLSGHLCDFWPDIKDSKWIGGTQDGWERLPYWLDGYIPLAALLRDESMLSKARFYIDAILTGQQKDGWICPVSQKERKSYDIWAAFLVAKVLVVWYDATRDARVEGAIEGILKNIDAHIRCNTLFNWAQTRWFECLIPLLWLYERKPEEWIARLAKKLQAQGFDWGAYFAHWPEETPAPQGVWSQMNHVVNNAMMLKYPALLMRLFPQETSMEQSALMFERLQECHGSANGTFTGDECLAGKSPVAGTELCAVAELMYSMQWIQTQSEDTNWGDRLEKIAFNAWPATFDPLMWTHQYVQQANQIQAVRVENPLYRTNGPDANTYGLEPEFGCCTANLSQGWPKLIQSVFYQRQSGIDVAVYLPCRLNTQIDGQPLSVRIDTEYPFRETIQISVENPMQKAFTLRLRIPEWAKNAVLSQDGHTCACTPAQYASVEICKSHTHLTLTLPQEPFFEQRPKQMACLHRGPLLYALAFKEKWERCHQDVPGREYPHCDYQVTSDTPWNYGFIAGETPIFREHDLSNPVFSPINAPVDAIVPCREVNWPIVRQAAAPVPDTADTGERRTVLFLPYGCTGLRMTELPWLDE